jgi:predicted exporter
MSFIAVFRSNVSLIVLGIGSIIIGIAVNYPLHFIAHIAHGGNIREVLKDMVSPLLIGNITTVGAFASLIPLKAPALRDLGLFAAFMLVGTILFVLVFLPHMVNTHNSEGKERLLFGRLSTFSFKIRGWMFWMIIALTVVMGYYSLGTSFDANMHHINYLTPTQERLMADLHISAGVNDTSNVYLVSEGETWN